MLQLPVRTTGKHALDLSVAQRLGMHVSGRHVRLAGDDEIIDRGKHATREQCGHCDIGETFVAREHRLGLVHFGSISSN